MSIASDYVTLLTRNGVKLWVDNGQLRYHAKKGAFTSADLAQLRSLKSEIIAELTEYPVSFQQRWFLRLMEVHPDWRATLSYTFHLKGALNPTILKRSLENIVREHPSLRTSIVRINGEWRQKIVPLDGFHLPILQVPGESDYERQQIALQRAHENEARVIDPTVAPLVAAQLLRLSAEEHFLVLLIHRLVADCVGMGQALRDLWRSYAKGASEVVEDVAEYRNYTLRQHAMDGAWREKHVPYWSDHLAGARPILWPTQDYAPPTIRTVSGELVSLEISFGAELSAGLREVGRETQTLPALVMLSLYIVALSIQCGQKDLLMPFVIAGRAASQEAIVGCFSYLVYLRIRLEGRESFIDVLKQVSNEFYKAATFRQDSGRVALERPDLLRGTLCQWLSWHPADFAKSQADNQSPPPGLDVRKLRCSILEELTNVPPQKVDLEMNFFEASGEISALALYRSDRFVEGMPERLMEELRALAWRAVRNLSEPITENGK